MRAGFVNVALFGVFDGHGGKQAATYASNHVMANLLDVLQDVQLPAKAVRPLTRRTGAVAAMSTLAMCGQRLATHVQKVHVCTSVQGCSCS